MGSTRHDTGTTAQEGASRPMRAVVQDGYGGSEVLRVAERPAPRPGPGEVVIVPDRALAVNAAQDGLAGREVTPVGRMGHEGRL